MRASIAFAALALAAGHVAADTPDSFEALIKSTPTCMQDCWDTVYTDLVGDKCSKDAKSSTKASDIACICKITGDSKSQNQAELKAATCITSKCDNATASDADLTVKALKDLTDLCSKNGASTSSATVSPSASSTSSSTSSSSSSSSSSSASASSSESSSASSTQSASPTESSGATETENAAVSMKHTSLLAGAGVVFAAVLL